MTSFRDKTLDEKLDKQIDEIEESLRIAQARTFERQKVEREISRLETVISRLASAHSDHMLRPI